MTPSRLFWLSAFLFLVSMPAAGAALRISEFLALNSTGLEDKDGDRSDWIEIHNPGDSSMDLAGWHLTDDPDNPTKWRLPSGTVAPGGYTLIFASGKDFSSLFNVELHANFSLSSVGEYLALIEPDGVKIAHEFAPEYPEQRGDISYGQAADGETLGYFAQPTPGEANGPVSEGLVAAVKYSVKRGYYDEPVTLELTTDTPGAVIHYTVNGKTPSLFTSSPYTGPITIDKTTTIRAHAVKEGFITSRLKTHTYLFVDDVAHQSTMSANVTEDPVYGPLIQDALLAHPSIMLVTPDTDISQTQEDPVSVEMITPDGTEDFQIDAGVKRVGGHSLNAYPKNNMRLYFRSEYGAGKLRFPLYKNHPYTFEAAEEFDQLNLRGGSHDSVFYLGANSQSPSNAQYLRNRWINDMQFLMGHESLRGRWVHVYINSIYWGHYQIMERPTQDYFASYLGGKKDDYVAVNKGQGVGSSDMAAWQAMQAARNNYAEFQRWVDVENYVDYMLLNYYAGNDWDWNPEQNWAGGGPVTPDSGGMKFIAWDSDIIFRRLNDNNLGKPGPHSMFPVLMEDEDFAVYVADRIQKHFYNDGLLTPDKVAESYNFRAEQIRLSIVPETARWENGRWTRDNQWQDELDRLNNDFFPNRTNEVLDQFKAKGWTGAISAPGMNQWGGYVDRDFEVKLTKSLFARGKIVYTLDGSDPRLPGGDMAPQAAEYQGGIVLTEPTVVKARIVNSDGWSALIEARFAVDQTPATSDNLTISKIHYRPAAASPEEIGAGYGSRGDFEFIELTNLGETTIDLHDVHLVDGITFRFATAAITHLDAGDRLFLVKNPDAFIMRYGNGLPIAGTFSGSLSNDGERLQIANEASEILQELTYNDVAPWPEEADGEGPFLVLKATEKAELENPEQWRASEAGETPGSTSPEPSGLTYSVWAQTAFSSGAGTEPHSDADDDGIANLLEFVFATDPDDADSRPAFTVERRAGAVALITRQLSEFAGVTITLETSSELVTWSPVAAPPERRPVDGTPGIDEVTHEFDFSAKHSYYRYRASLE